MKGWLRLLHLRRSQLQENQWPQCPLEAQQCFVVFRFGVSLPTMLDSSGWSAAPLRPSVQTGEAS